MANHSFGNKSTAPGASKAKNFKGTLKKLIQMLSAYKLPMLVMLIFAIMSTIFSIVGPKMMGNATTSIFKSLGIAKATGAAIAIDFSYIEKIAITLVILYAFSALFGFLQGFIISKVSQKLTYSMRKDISQKINLIPLKYYDSVTHGEVLSRITNDVDTVSQSLQQGLSQIVTSVTMIIGIIIMMLSISPLMTLIALVSLPISGLIISLIVKLSQKHFFNQQKHLGHLNGHIEEMFSGHTIIKSYNLEEKSISEFDDINAKLYNSAWKSQFLSSLMMPIINIVGNLGYIAVCVLGGFLHIKSGFAVGGIQSFIQYIRMFNQPIAQTAQISNVLQQTVAAAERVFEFLEEGEEIPETANPVKLDKVEGTVSFSQVSFGYNETAEILKNVSFDVKPGQTVAIVGPTGAGKTTIINLLMRFYDINRGSITIDNVDIRDMTRGDLRKIFGMVLQDTWLFSGTIKDNLSYGKAEATDEEIASAAKSAHCSHFINTHADGFDMEINEEASNISQGQKQLLTIARAILADPPILILDEATSSVDTRTEIRIQKAMKNLMKNRTSFVIAHRLSTIRDADLILVMKDGDIIEHGTHTQLMEMNGFYSELYNSQFDKVG